MRRRTRIVRAVALVILLGTLAGGFTPLAPVAASARVRDRGGMLELTNRSRQLRDLRALDLDAEMSRLAYRHSVKMARKGSLVHTADPESTYLRGVRWQMWGENVGVAGDLESLQDAFMGSSPHRRNILKPGFRNVAVGVVRDDGRLWVTVFFYA